MAPLVLIVADDTMEEGEFFVQEVAGLRHTRLVDSTGFLVFTKTRNSNAAFYR